MAVALKVGGFSGVPNEVYVVGIFVELTVESSCCDTVTIGIERRAAVHGRGSNMSEDDDELVVGKENDTVDALAAAAGPDKVDEVAAKLTAWGFDSYLNPPEDVVRVGEERDVLVEHEGISPKTGLNVGLEAGNDASDTTSVLSDEDRCIFNELDSIEGSDVDATVEDGISPAEDVHVVGNVVVAVATSFEISCVEVFTIHFDEDDTLLSAETKSCF